MKSQIPKNDMKFSYINNHKSIIFAGSVIKKCNSNDKSGKVFALVLNTGINTIRGNSIQNILFPKPSNINLIKEFIIFVVITIIIAGVSAGFVVYYYFYSTNNSTTVLDMDHNWFFKLKLLQIITSLCPPILPICVTFTCFYFQYKLDNKNIQCLSEVRLYGAGRVNILILDKTGTLTEDDIELHGFQTTLINELDSNPKKVTDFDKVELDARLYNKLYIEFWKKFSKNPDDPIFENYRDNYKYNMIFFLECLATCHSIDKMNDESLGNNIDLNILNCVKWHQEKSNYIENEHDIVTFIIYFSIAKI